MEDFLNVEIPYDAQEDAIIFITSQLWVEKEDNIATILGDISILTNNLVLSGTDQYSDEDNSNPLADFAQARVAIQRATGMKPNKAIMSFEVAIQLKKHPLILTRLGFNQVRAGEITDVELAKVMQVKEVLIGDTIIDNAVEGQPDDFQPIWGKNIIFGIFPKVAAKRQVSVGYRVQSKRSPRQIKIINLDNPIGAQEVLSDDWYQHKIVNADAAFLIKDAVL